MTKYLTDERFIVHSNTKEAQQNYRDNWERNFGEKPKHVDGCIVPRCPGCDDGEPERADSDAVDIRLKSYANLIVPLGALTRECGCEGAVVRNCPYQGDVNNDEDQRCKCCDACAHSCAMDI